MVKVMRDGARLCPLPGPPRPCHPCRHGDNTWKFAEGRSLVEDDWSRRSWTTWRHALRPDKPEGPLVSCIMPTFNRHHFVCHAIELFLAQDCPRRELILVERPTVILYLGADVMPPTGADSSEGRYGCVTV
jgi:hypothetical protein